MKRKVLLILSISFALLSCSDFLEEIPRHQWEMSVAVSSYADAEQAVNGIYGASLLTDNLNGKLNLAYCDRSGLTKKDAMEYNFTHKTSMEYNFTGPWYDLYDGINSCNIAISQIPNVPDNAFPTETAKNELIGEARLLRAWFNSMVLLNYACWYAEDASPYGIIYRSEPSNLANIHQPRITVGDSWKYIFEDIDYAITNMSDKFATNRRASKIFAKGLKARLLLIRGVNQNIQEYLTEALDLIDECIAALPAAGIAMQADMAQHFKESWDSKENIFVRYLNEGKRGAYNGAGTTTINTIWAYLGTSTSSATQAEAACGLQYGLDWMQADPRWYIATGKAKGPASYNSSQEKWTWTKIYRKGEYWGKQAPVDDKYATYYMRVPELYIMKAELLARTGASEADAIAPINEMRAKRTNPVLEALPTPANDQEMWDMIFQEYVKELILENGCEWFASLRIKKNGVTYMEHMKEGSGYVFDGTILQWPIPKQEMTNNKAIAGMQNPGQE